MNEQHPTNPTLYDLKDPGACINCKMECRWWLTVEGTDNDGVWRIHDGCIEPFATRLTEGKRLEKLEREKTMPSLRKRAQIFRGEENIHNAADDHP